VYALTAVVILACLGAVGAGAATVLGLLLAVIMAGLAVTMSGSRGVLRTAAGFAGAAVRFLAVDARAFPHRVMDLLAGTPGGEPLADVPAAVPAAPAPGPFTPARVPARGAVRRPAIRAQRAVASAGQGTAAPAGWGAIAAATSDFRSESNIEFAGWLTGEALGVFAWAEAMVEQHEASRDEIGVDAAAIAALDDVATAIVGCAETIAGAVSRFCAHFELPDAFVDAGGKLAHDGNWHQGSPNL
jgi:hypothetical protein